MTNHSKTRPLPASIPVVNKSILINAPLERVWEILTIPELLKQWMFPTELEIMTDWQVGSPFIIRGILHGIPFENKGTVIKFEPRRVLQYSHLSSVSRLADEPANYTTIEFRLTPVSRNETDLALTLQNFPTQVIYKHLNFYWNSALAVIKQRLEQGA